MTGVTLNVLRSPTTTAELRPTVDDIDDLGPVRRKIHRAAASRAPERRGVGGEAILLR